MIRFITPILGLAMMTSASTADPLPVNTDNFVRAESDLYFAGVLSLGLILPQ